MHQISKSKTKTKTSKIFTHAQGKTKQNKHLQSNYHQW